tara:strand:+ start:33377 stop:33658 length:282 start_codon:yes stop_codon:yes gene_type:complete
MNVTSQLRTFADNDNRDEVQASYEYRRDFVRGFIDACDDTCDTDTYTSDAYMDGQDACENFEGIYGEPPLPEHAAEAYADCQVNGSGHNFTWL